MTSESIPGPVAAAGAAVRVRGLTRVYATQIALAGIDLDVEPGELVAVIGRSGSGKTTLLQVLGAMDTASSGFVSVGGHELAGLGPTGRARFRRRIGFVFQRFHLLASLTAVENVLAPLVPSRPGRADVERAEALLDEVGLAGRYGALPSELSGGQQQRVAIARALSVRPELILADEPTGNLDSATSEQILDLLTSVRRAHRTTMIVATHDAAVAGRCDRLVRLADGALVGDRPSTGPEHLDLGSATDA